MEKEAEMASIVKRGNKYYVIYNYTDKNGDKKQKWESYKTMVEAKTRQREIEYKKQAGSLVVPQCKNMDELLSEYVSLYGRNKWAMSTYSSNVSVIDRYIRPVIGRMALKDITPRVLENYYQQLLKTKTVKKKPEKSGGGKTGDACVSRSVVRDVHKLLHNCFGQAIKWELMERNPAEHATVPRYEAEKREIWTAETLFHAIEVCEDKRLALALHLSFCGSLRIGELLGLTWDCVDISEGSVARGQASIIVNKELQRVDRSVAGTVENPDIIFQFPPVSSQTKTLQVLKAPKTRSSVRKVFLPATVAQLLAEWKREQDDIKEALGDDYQDYNLVMAGSLGMPTEARTITSAFQRLISEHDLPKVVFHSLRHSSITYKLKLNGGDIKAVQGDSGHSQASMVTEVYSHILDEDRQKNAELFEKEFYSGKDAAEEADGTGPESPSNPGTDAAELLKLLGDPEKAATLKALLAVLGK